LLLFVVRGTHMAGQRPGGVLTDKSDKTCAASLRFISFSKLLLAVKHACQILGAKAEREQKNRIICRNIIPGTTIQVPSVVSTL